MVRNFYKELRKVAKSNTGMSVTVRQIEAVIRLSQGIVFFKT